MRLRNALCVLLLCLAFCCCGTGTIRTLDISNIKAVSVLRVGHESADIELEGEVLNPHRSEAVIRDFSYRISVGNQFFLTGHMPGPLELPAHASTSIRMPLTVQYSQVTGADCRALFATAIPYRLRGTAGMEKPFKKQLKIAAAGSLQGPQELAVTLMPGTTSRLVSTDDIDIDAVHLSSVEAVFRMLVRNPFPFQLQVDHLDYRLVSGGDTVGEGSARRPLLLEPGAQLLRFPVSFRTGGLIGSLLHAVPKLDVPHLSVSGSAKISGENRTVLVTFKTLPK